MNNKLNKRAQLRAIWPLVYQKLKSPPPGVNLGSFPSQLPPMNKIKFDSSAHSDEAGAIGYVSTEDSDQNGTLDTMHIVVPNLEKHLQGISPADLQDNNPQKLYQILAPFVELIAHEMGHQKDYQHGKDNPFPGGETVADQAAQQALNQFSVQATNNLNKNDIKRSSLMNKEIITRLAKLAGDLDEKGAYKLSDEVLAVAEKFAQDMGGRKFQFADWPASDAPFEWGNWRGARPGEAYMVSIDRPSGSLGSVQFPGDPFTYEPTGAGKLRVVSGPERNKQAIGVVIDDPRAKEEAPAQEPAVEGTRPDVTTYKQEGLSEALRDIGLKSATDLGSLKARRAKVVEQYQEAVDKAIRVFDSTTAATVRGEAAFGRLRDMHGNPYQAEKFVQKDIKSVLSTQPQGNTAWLAFNKALDVLVTLQKVDKAIRLMEQDSTSYADDQESDAMDLQPQSADDGADKEGLDAEASLTAEELTKNASANAVFWKQNVKTPFGR